MSGGRGNLHRTDMKILLVHKYHFLMGGAERAYLDMGDILRRAGHEVAFFSMKHPRNISTPWEKYFVDGVDYNDDGVGFLDKIRAVRNIFWNRQAERNMERLIRDFHPDIAHIHNIFHQISPSILRPLKNAGIPAVMTLHDYKLISPNYYLFSHGRVWDPGPRGLWKCIGDRCVKDSVLKSAVCVLEGMVHKKMRLYDSVRLFLSPSRFLIDKFSEYKFPYPISYLPNPLIPFPSDYSLTPISHDAPFVFIGRLSPEKGVDVLIRALALLGDSSLLRIVGEGLEKERLQALARDLGVESRVEFLGYLSGEALGRVRAEARVLLVPSLWYENMPYALTEALGAGKVVIGARMGGITERIRDGENGFLFDPTNAEELAEKMRLARHLDSAKIGASARESITDLREECFLENLTSMYRRVLRKAVL